MPKGLYLVSLYPEHNNPEMVYISYCNYSGHRAKHGGCHYTAAYSGRLSIEELFCVLDGAGVLKRGLGNEPDLVDCAACGKTVYGDEAEFNWEDGSIYCKECAHVQSP